MVVEQAPMPARSLPVIRTLAERYTRRTGTVQLTGIQALARLPIDQHRRDRARGRNVATFVSGYEGSPLAGFDLELGRIGELLDDNDVVFRPGLNEEAAATAIQGTQLLGGHGDATYDGVVGLWYGKAPGLDRATDAIRHGNLMGADPRGGVVLLVGDDPAAKSSSVPCASELALADLHVPTLYPADSQDILRLGQHAIELSRASGLWTALKIVTNVADGSGPVSLDAPFGEPVLARRAGRHEPTARLLQPMLGPIERDLVTNRLDLAREYARDNGLNTIIGRAPGDRVGIVAAGRTWQDTMVALERLNLAVEDSPVRVLRLGMVWPLEPEIVREFADGLDQIIVIEEKRSFLEAGLREILYGTERAPAISGKDLFPAYGELDVDTILPLLGRRLRAEGLVREEPAAPVVRTLLPLARRAPYFCSGCPHNSSTATTSGATGDGVLIGAGIGCHAMVLLMDEGQVGRVTGLSQMGGEGLQWIGLSPFMKRDHYVQNLGDGTFDHSGSLAVRAAVAAGVNITYKLLYNSAVAMTGGQAAVGGMGVRQIVDVLLAERVARVIVTTEDLGRYRKVTLPRGVVVWDRSRIEEAMTLLAATPGVTVLVHDQECATEKRRRRKRTAAQATSTRVVINERVCEGCGDCGRKSNCLSVYPIETPLGRKTRIDQTTCNIDYSCLDGDCPAFMTVEVPAGKKARVAVGDLGPDDLPAPPRDRERTTTGVRITGIGGTGVVTISQIVATAGLLGGWHARSLDQTGLAQKGGAVVSDVVLTRGDGIATNKISAGSCDLYLGCDLLVAADERNLRVAAADRTVAVLSTSVVPTGAMVSDPAVGLPDTAGVAEQLAGVFREPPLNLDARAVSGRLFGDDQYANMLLLGAGFQTGALPLPASAIEEAIRLNGVAVEKNLQAFRRGRQAVADPAGVPWNTPDEQAEPRDAARWRYEDLVAYQNVAYADAYQQVVDRVRAADRADGRLTEAVAAGLYKLMAYKDEYEVARLSLDPAMDERIAEQFGPGARASWRLHPPALRALGMRQKLTLGPAFRVGFRALAAARRVRGTALDPFGLARVRRVERALIEEYRRVAETLRAGLTPENYDLAVRIAGLPDLVRGYEQVKLRNVESYHAQLRALLAEFTNTAGPGTHAR
ncbi:indolepyruvate ferredoxin oxidoreductase family protein [Actinoplanes sp. HUAS TT8]|uniref:indolepyruvate ferredoxin oxidoreductase family protein n=1 Tax=Actinoplanes sp. HUAS TT8 TaxID=3447453 RepID=UPI003F527748